VDAKPRTRWLTTLDRRKGPPLAGRASGAQAEGKLRSRAGQPAHDVFDIGLGAASKDRDPVEAAATVEGPGALGPYAVAAVAAVEGSLARRASDAYRQTVG